MSYTDKILTSKGDAEGLLKDLSSFLRTGYADSVSIAEQEITLMKLVKELKLSLTDTTTPTPGVAGILEATTSKLDMTTGGSRNIGLIIPMAKKFTYTSPFGPRWGRMHWGVDMASFATSSPIVAAAAGQVVYAGRGWSGGGNVVMIYHSSGSAIGHTTVYMHLASISVRVNQVVAQGTVIGIEGDTDAPGQMHLHFEVQIGRGPQDSSTSPSPEALSRLSYSPTPTYIHGKGYSKIVASQNPRLYLP